MANRLIPGLLVALLLVLHAQLWFGRGSVPQVAQLRRDLAAQLEANELARQRNAQIGGGYKTLTVEVAPNTTYLVAARLNEDQRDNPANGAYWDPVVYRESPEACR